MPTGSRSRKESLSLFVYRDWSSRMGQLSTAMITFSILTSPAADRCRANVVVRRPASDMLANIFRPHFCVPSQLSQCLSLMSSVCDCYVCMKARERKRERSPQPGLVHGTGCWSDLIDFVRGQTLRNVQLFGQ